MSQQDEASFFVRGFVPRIFLLRRMFMKKLAVVISVILLLSTLFGCSVDDLDVSSNLSEETLDVESVVSQLVEETTAESSEEISSEGSTETSDLESSEDISSEESVEESSEEVSSQHQHTFSEATCTQPKTCECGETEGNPLEHKWGKATCKVLKTCSVCGVTEGEYAEHSWEKATCKAPKTCSVCGKTEGNALNHQWSAASCTRAATCALCGKTSGEPKGHTYYDGKCTSCGEKDPSYTSSEQMVWIPTKGGTKYHSNSACSNMNGPIYVTISEAKRKGFTACKKCY